MIDFRWVVPEDTTTAPPRLQFRFMQPTIDASGALCPGDWVPWQDIPTVVIDERKDS